MPTSVEELKAKVVLVGAPGVGKTSLVRRYVLNEFSERYRMTLGAIVYKREEDVAFESRTVRVTMTLWDTMGEPTLMDPLRDVYLTGAQGVLAVADVTDGNTVPVMDRWMDAAVQVAGDVPVQILMNKADLGARTDAQYAGLSSALHRSAPCWLTSAKQGDNVTAAFQDLARRIVELHLVPVDGDLDRVDERILVDLSAGARTPEEVSRTHGLAAIVVDARLERLRRRGFVRLATLGMDPAGRPQASFARTDRPLADLLRARA